MYKKNYVLWKKDSSEISTFGYACCYSNHRAAMIFADKTKYYGRNFLEFYADLRGTDEQTLRDTQLSYVDLSPEGTKAYDLGNQTVTVRMQPDYSFIIELPDGKTAKSLPKKGSDEKLYEVASKDFADLKKDVKKIAKNRSSYLFEAFLSGEETKAKAWHDVYTSNPVPKQISMLIVWSQGGKTFTMTDSGLIDSTGAAYTFGKSPVLVAHPIEMEKEEIERWQKYFTSRSLKQPFPQIWEPVIDPKTIKKERYVGCMIPYYRFMKQEKHGIDTDTSGIYTSDNSVDITFMGIEADIERIDFERHSISPENRFEIKSINFKNFTRQVNHLIAYFDRITVWDRVRNDDITISETLPEFTAAQISEFIAAAQEAKAVNVLALLMEHKNKNFADLDPMAEFTLNW